MIQYDSSAINLPTPNPLYIGPSNYNSSSSMGLFDAIGGVVGSVVNAVSGARQNAKNRKFQEKMQNQQNAFTERMWYQQNDWNLAQWNRENAYNTASAQMQRAMDAGINPNTAAGAIAGSQANAPALQADSVQGAGASGQGVVTPIQPGSDLVTIMNGLKDLKKKDSEIDLNEANAGKAKAETVLTEEEVKVTTQRWKDLMFKNDVLNPLEQKQMEKIIDNLVKTGQLTDKQVEKINEEISIFVKQKQEIQARIDELKEQVRLLKEQVKSEQSQQALNAANAALAGAEKDLKKAEADGQTLLNNFESSLQEVGMSTHQSNNPVIAAAQTAAVNANKAYKTVQQRKSYCDKYNAAHKGEDVYLYVNKAGQIVYGSRQADTVKTGKAAQKKAVRRQNTQNTKRALKKGHRAITDYQHIPGAVMR